MNKYDENYFNNLASNGVISGDEIRLFVGRILQYGYRGTISTSCLRHLSQKYAFTRMTLILFTKPLSKIMWSACLNRSISTLGQMDLGKAELFISETRMESFLR